MLTGAVLQVAAAEPIDAFDVATIQQQITELQGTLDRLQIELARRVRSFDDRAGYRLDGHSSTTSFLRDRARMTGGRAKRTLMEAKALAAMPATSTLAADGELSLDQARVLIRARQQQPAAFDRDEDFLTEVARDTRFVSHFSTAVAHWTHAVAEPPTPDEDHEKRALHVSRTWEGMVRIDGWLDAEAGEILLRALDSVMAPPAPGDIRSASQRRADALVDLVSGRARSRVPEIVVHVGDDRMVGKAESSDGFVIDDARLSRLVCDCTLHRVVFGTDRQPIDVGRRHRLVTGSQRRALAARDRGCRFPGCDRPANWTDAHHIVHWIGGGRTDLHNLILLCRHHHVLVHDGGWMLTGTAEHFEVRRPDGSVLDGERRSVRKRVA
jgi:hypothetical protein